MPVTSHRLVLGKPVKQGYVYFHSPCFDGIVSAVVVTDWLNMQQKWSGFALQVVNYDLKDRWVNTELGRPAVVVDFLFHPGADIWVDHHRTAYVDTSYPVLDPTRLRIYDPAAGSCAGLLWRHLNERFAYRNERFTDLVRWAEKIDAARYDSVEEAIGSRAPALRINAALSVVSGDEFPKWLVGRLREQSLASVANLPAVRKRYEEVRQIADIGLERFKRAAQLHKEIVVFDVDAQDVTINRYAPYYYFPEARYSAGIVRTADHAKIAVMRNPWRDFVPAPLGDICAKYGGGGHERVGAILITGERIHDARRILDSVIADIRRYEHPATRDDRAL